MDKRIKKRWIAALRSRKYKQGEGLLRQKGDTKKQVDRFCCLGVLCELAVKAKVIPPAVIDFEMEKYFYAGASQELPGEVMKWAKIGTSCGSFTRASDRSDTDLAELNDKGMPFNKIANYIEKYF